LPAAKSGVGAYVNYVKPGNRITAGVRNVTWFSVGVMGSYDYELSESSILRLGFGASLLHYNDQYNANSIGSGGGASVGERLPGQTFKPALDVGILFEKGRFYLGFSVKQFNEPEFRLWDGGGAAKIQRKAFLSGGTEFYFGDFLAFRPSFILADYGGGTGGFFRSWRSDINVLMSYKDKFFWALGGKLNNPDYIMSLMIGGRFAKKFQANLAYDLKKSSSPAGKQIELSLGYFLSFDDE